MKTYLAISLLAASAASTSASAATITAIPQSSLILTDSVFQAKYRLSNTNFDQTIDDGSGTSGSGATKTFLERGIGNNSQLSAVVFDFTIEHLAGEGFLFTMTRNGVVNPTVHSIGWGTFSSATPATVASAMGNGSRPGDAFNIFHITARATNGNITGESMEYRNLAFIGLTPVGLLSGQTASEGTVRDQWLVSTSDLSQIDWKVTGQLIGTRSGSGGDETVKFEFSAKQGSVVPEPSTWAMMALAGVAGLMAYRRR